jgi:hypothetical protein
MKKQNTTNYCSLEKGEIFPSNALLSDAYSKAESLKAEKAKKTRSAYQELMSNYNQTH